MTSSWFLIPHWTTMHGQPHIKYMRAVTWKEMYQYICYKLESIKSTCKIWRRLQRVNIYIYIYRYAVKSLARPGRKQASFLQNGVNLLRRLAPQKKTWWQLASRFCWNRERPWHASDRVSCLVGLRTYQHSGKMGRYQASPKVRCSPVENLPSHRRSDSLSAAGW